MSFNILTDRLPDSVTVSGVSYRIRTDFRRWILMLDLFDRCRNCSPMRLDTLTAAKCAVHIVMPEYGENNDLSAPTLIGLLEEFVRFAYSARPLDTGNTRAGDVSGRDSRVFDFSCDAELILSSFLREYGIDLTRENLHWWRFLALLRSLPSDSDFMRVVRLRLCDTTKIADDGLRRQLRRAKAAVRLKPSVGESLTKGD